MKKPQSIQISIPTPCTQPWDEMKTDANGRFCGHCQKTVIDFTGYSDKDLHRFFRQNVGESYCGKLLRTQLDRNISLPYQPDSRLYKMFIALGLSLLFTSVNSNAKQINVGVTNEFYSLPEDIVGNDDQSGNLTGVVTDNNKKPLGGVQIIVYESDNIITGTKTDSKGRYVIEHLPIGSYTISATYNEHSNDRGIFVDIAANKTEAINIIIDTKWKPKPKEQDNYATYGIIIPTK